MNAVISTLRNSILAITVLLGSGTYVLAQCPTSGGVITKAHTDISCFGASDGTITVELGDGDAPMNFELYDNVDGTFIVPGPGSIDKQVDPDGNGNFRKVTFSRLYASSFQVVVFKAGCTTLSISEGFTGIVISEPTAVAVTSAATPDCDANPGSGTGSITLNISGGTGPYDITWPSAVTPIADNNGVAAGNHAFPGLDGGTYTVEIRDANNCLFTTDIDVRMATMPSAGADQTVCGFSATLNANAPAAGETGTWTGPAGVTFSPDANTPNAIASNLSIGVNLLTWTISDNTATCAPISDQVQITSDDPPTVDAGAPQTICADATASLAGTIGGVAGSATWTTSGDGSFDNATALNAVYTPGNNDVSAGTVTLTITTNDPAGPCASVNDNVLITIDAVATADAGADQTICAGGTVTLAGVPGGAAASGTWTTSGNGSFDDATSNNAVYTPGPDDLTNGTVTLTFTTNDPAGPCGPVIDDLVVTIDDPATVDAGLPQTICAGTSATLAGVRGGSASGATWTTSGDGTFDNAISLNASYTPGPNDVSANTVTLTLTTNDPTGPCGPVSDNVVITIDVPATVDAGSDQTICATGTATLAAVLGGAAGSGVWTTSGNGSFDNAALPGAVYTPGANDITNGTVTLTFTSDDPAGPCGPASDAVVITIDAPATVDAGLPQTICSGSTVSLTGAIGGSAGSATWTTSGTGSFDNPNALTAIYTPDNDDLIAGSVTLTLTSDDPAGPCGPSTDNVVITFDAGATVDAGADQTICADGTAALAGAFGGTAASGTWTTAGNGSFDDPTLPGAVYTPGAADLAAGSVTLTFTTDDPAGPCGPVSDVVVITFANPASVDAGADQAICAGATVSLAGTIAGSAGSAIWSTSGTGTFDNAASLTATYTPGAEDLTAGTVTLTLTTDDPAGPCGPVADNVVVTFDEPATADAGIDQTICPEGSAALTGSVAGTATSGSWTTAGDGTFDNAASLTATYTPGTNDIANGIVTLTLTTDDPAGACGPVSDGVDITITPAATVEAGAAQAICAGGTASLAATFTEATSVVWTTSGDGSFDDATLNNAVYTPGATDISNGTVTLTATTVGPCAAAQDDVVITINAAPEVEAGTAQTICSDAQVVLSGSFSGSATGLTWSTSGDGSFSDVTDPDATYTPGTLDSTNQTVTLRATATGSCAGTFDEVTITVNRAASVNAGGPQTICVGSNVSLNAILSGSAASVGWTTSGDGVFGDAANPVTSYTPGAADLTNGTVTLSVTTNNPPGPCPAGIDNVVVTIIPIPGDQVTAGNETWIGYVYDDTGDPTPIPAKIDFDNAKYRGFITEADIVSMTALSGYDVASDTFDLNLNITDPLQGPNVCGSYLNHFSVRYKMNKTFAAGVYRFTVGGDDGIRLLIDGIDVLPAGSFDLHSYTTYTSAPHCLTAGVHTFEIQYFDNTAQSRVSFDYEPVPTLVTTTPVAVCVNTPAPSLTVSSPDAAVVDYNWYKNGTLVFTGATYTPAATELDMTAAATTTFAVAAVYACGETQPVDVVVDVLNNAVLTLDPQSVCEDAGVVDLRTLVSAVPPGGTFTFQGHPNITGNNFDPTGLAGTTVAILVDYTTGSCTAPQGTLNLTITNTATINAPTTPVPACESSAGIDLTTLVTGVPAGGTFSFAGPQVNGNTFDPSTLSGIQTITVDYSAGGCAAPQTTFDINVTSSASITANPTTACKNGSPVNLLTRVSATPPGGTFAFTGAGVSGNLFDPSAQSGTVSVTVDYDFNGCTASEILLIDVLEATDGSCAAGNCASVVIVPKTKPATCTNSDGQVVISLVPFTPAVNNTGVKISIDGTSSTGLPVAFTIYNDSTFNNLPVGLYNYTVEYGDPSCIKTGTFSIDQSGTVGTPVVSNLVSPVCAGTASGSLTLDIPGETGNVLEWSLDGGLTDPFKPFIAGSKISGIPAGPAPSYQQVISVRRNAADVCYSSITVTIPESVSPISATFSITPATCNANDGAITNIVAGGGNDAPFTYSIDGGLTFQSGTSFNGLAGGNYTLRIKDAGGCERDFPVSVTFPGYVDFDFERANADCQGNKGSIKVTVDDPGQFKVALVTDPSVTPEEEQYRAPLNESNPVFFGDLAAGNYFILVKTTESTCPTQTGPIEIKDYQPISFELQPDCDDNKLSLGLVNIAGDAAGPQLQIKVFRKLSTDPPELINEGFPANREIYLDHDQYTFLQTPGAYQIMVVQVQTLSDTEFCDLSSPRVDLTVPTPLSAQVVFVSESYPDVPTGELRVSAISGGIYPFDVRIELDSAASFSLPFYQTDFAEAGLNADQQIEMHYKNVPAGRYHVEVMDSLGCVIDLTARVPLDVDLFIPNVFTPNGDGSNDVFYIRNLPQESATNALVITNRWGKQVFASENYQNNWNGEGVADGIYFYRLQVLDNEPLTGWVEIMRGQKP